MAIVNYTTELSLTNSSNILLSNPSTPPTTFTAPALEDSTLTNMITGDDYLMTSSQFPTSPLPCTFTLNSVTGGFGATYGDSVYKYEGAIALADDYVTEAYLLVTTAIDAAIPLMPQTTGREVATYNAAVAIRQNVQDYFDAANYTDANKYIIYLTNLLTDLTEGGALVPVATLPAPETINTSLATTTVVFTDAFGYFNALTNTLTGVEYQYVWDFTPNSATPQDNDTAQSSLYPDGVYTDYVSVLCTFDDSGNFPALINQGTGYLLVTTTITAGITSWQVAYDQLVNPTQTQIDDNTFLDGALAAIQAAFDAELYTQANALITQVQAILSGGIGIAMYLNLATTGTKAYKEANMLNYFLSGSLPSGTYTNQDSTLTNTITNEAWSFPSTYPANSTDYTEILNSNDLATVSKWTDAVYRSNVEFNIGSTFYQCLGYCLVLTSMNCVITKITQSADSCKSLQKQLGKLVSLRQMAIDSFNAGNFTGANSAINKFNNVTSTCNCGCR